MARGKFYITTPIYYPNDRLHVGHTYTTVAADALARYHRLRGDDTWFLTGTDEHGQKIERRAREEGLEPKAYIDPIVEWIQGLWRRLHVSYDDFIRTTEDRHVRRVQEIFRRLHDQGDIYKGTYTGLYCVACEAFYAEGDLLEGRLCPVHEREVEPVSEESYFFRLSRYADPLLRHIEAHPEFIQPESRRNEVIGFIRQGLEDLSVSRTSFRWGVPVPFDPRHVVYVWIDALANYVSALGWPDGEAYRKYWPADVHLIGKDILRFHAIVWPALLMALGEPLPRAIYGHGWLMIGGRKIAKTGGGQVIDPLALVEKYGVDPVRYYLLREVPFGADGLYTEEALVRRLNADLANDLGNLLWRATAMLERFAGGVVPRPDPEHDDGQLARTAAEVRTRVEQAMDRFELSSALAAVWDLIKSANKYVDEEAPWDLNRAKRTGRLHAVLYNVLEAVRVAGALLAPFLVETPGRIWHELGLEDRVEDLGWERATMWGGLPPGQRVRRGAPLFPRIDLEEALGGADEGGPATGAGVPLPSAAGDTAPAPVAPAASQSAAPGQPAAPGGEGAAADRTVTPGEFARIQLRAARVVAARPHPGADRLLLLDVDLGGQRRQIVAGLAGHYRPEELVGRLVAVVANLKPARLRGELSQGMLLAAEGEGGAPRVLFLPDDVLPGAPIR